MSGRNYGETWAGCIVSLSVPTKPSLKAFRSVWSFSLAEMASRAMYACVPENGGGFSRGCAGETISLLILKTYPPTLIGELTPANANCSKSDRGRWYIISPVRPTRHL
jgi:hypothetical protein